MSNQYSLRTLLAYCTVVFSAATLAHGDTETYSVQVGAFSSPSPNLTDSYKQYGSVRIQRDAEFARVLIGAFTSKDDAELLLVELQREGFSDAFVRRTPTTAATTTSGTVHTHLPAPDQRRIDQLSDAERSRAVYLDGVLHIKDGNTFTPLQ